MGRNWSLITNGPTFEALVSTLVKFDDSGARTYGKEGKDAGIDVKSGGGTVVYQAKYRREGTPLATVFADVKKELQSIQRYREQSHENYRKWEKVTKWRLCTNLPFSPQDEEKWCDQVVPLFQPLGITAQYWARSDLDMLLTKHPEVDLNFFEGEIRAFLTLGEIRESLPQREWFPGKGLEIPFRGRGLEIAEIYESLSFEKQDFLILQGPGGIGKTRLLLEAGDHIEATGNWNVYWLNENTMTTSSNWLRGIVPERPTVLLLDEPENEQILKLLVEQVGSTRMKGWKVIVAVRSSKDPILNICELLRLSHRLSYVYVSCLPVDQAEAMCIDLLNLESVRDIIPDDQRADLARQLANQFDQYPMWLTLAAHMLELDKNISPMPTTFRELAKGYVDEIIKSQGNLPSNIAMMLLRWVALLGPINKEDSGILSILTKVSGLQDGSTTIHRALAQLEKRRVLKLRGMRDRLVEVKPDIIRDYILIDWLAETESVTNPIPTDTAEGLTMVLAEALLTGDFKPVHLSILKAIARIERILNLAGHPISLLDLFFQTIREGVPQVSASIRKTIPEVLQSIAAFYPEDIVEISQLLRGSVVEDEEVRTIFGSRTIGYDNIILELPWLVYGAATGAQKAQQQFVLYELMQLAEHEVKIGTNKSLPNDGRRATQLISRIVMGGPEFRGNYFDVIATIIRQMLHDLVAVEKSKKWSAFEVLLKGALNVERHQWWAENYQFHDQTYLVVPGQSEWELRQEILAAVRRHLERSDVPQSFRLVLWDLLVTSHTNAIRCWDKGSESFREALYNGLLADLVWTRSLIVPGITDVRELETARKIWRWHCRAQKDSDKLKQYADELEALYTNNVIVSEFEYLLSHDDWQQKGTRCAEKAKELAEGDALGNITAFLARAEQFFTDDQALTQILPVAISLGPEVQCNESIRQFLEETLHDPVDSFRVEFARVIATEWVNTVRSGNKPEHVLEVIQKLVNECGSDAHRVQLLMRLFDFRHASIRSEEEHAYIRSCQKIFKNAGYMLDFIRLIGGTYLYDWPGLKALVEQIFSSLNDEEVDAAVEALIESVHWSLRNNGGVNLPADFGLWFLNQLVQISGISDFTGRYVEEIVKAVGPVSLSWLPTVLNRRHLMEQNATGRTVKAVDSHTQWARYVQVITPEMNSDPVIVEVCEKLVNLASNEGHVGYYLPDILSTVDPQGLVVPHIVADHVNLCSQLDGVLKFARISNGYTVNSCPWRIIAKSVLLSLQRLPSKRLRDSFFAILLKSGPHTWSGIPGTVPSWVKDNLERAERLIQCETDEIFQSLWQWNLEVATSELHTWEERMKEEQGE